MNIKKIEKLIQEITEDENFKIEIDREQIVAVTELEDIICKIAKINDAIGDVEFVKTYYSDMFNTNKKYLNFIDEIYLLFQYEYSANFLFTLWKRVRKYGAFCTGITQNVEDLLQSHTARTMLANSEFIVMLNQSSTDRLELAKLLNMSELQMSYITNSGPGEGLIKVGSALVPFINKYPKNLQLYMLMSTKPGEMVND